MSHPGTQVEYGIHEDCVQCHMVNRFPLAMLDWLINEVVQFGRKQ